MKYMATGRFTAFAALCLLTLLALQFPILHDNTAFAENKKIFLKQADSVEGGETASETGKPEPFRSAVGNVLFLHDKVTLKCDRATEFPESNRITLNGNIFVNDGTVEVYGDNGIYYPEEQVGEMIDNVRGRVVRDSLVSRANKAVFNLKTNELWLYDNAIAWHKGNQLSGDIILVHIRDVKGEKKVDQIQVHGHAFFAGRDTVAVTQRLYNQLSGQNMVINIDDSSHVSGITVTKEARSLYHFYDEENAPSGVNYSSGDIIRMFFNAGKLSRVLVTGNVEGKQYPNRMRGNRDINLPGFLWKEKEIPVFK